MGMLRRLSIALLSSPLLVACAATPTIAPTPIVQTVVVTQVVEVEVTREVERVVTATPLPATATPAATPTPEAPPLALGRDVSAHNGPTEQYSVVAELAAGTTVDARSRVEGWVEIRVNGEEAWVPADAVDGDVSTLKPYADALPVLDGEVVQEFLADSVLFKGRVRNLGGRTAGNVRVEIELVDADERRLEIDNALVDGFDVAPGADATFQVILQDVPGWEFYYSTVRWENE